MERESCWTLQLHKPSDIFSILFVLWSHQSKGARTWLSDTFTLTWKLFGATSGIWAYYSIPLTFHFHLFGVLLLFHYFHAFNVLKINLSNIFMVDLFQWFLVRKLFKWCDLPFLYTGNFWIVMRVKAREGEKVSYMWIWGPRVNSDRGKWILSRRYWRALVTAADNLITLITTHLSLEWILRFKFS